MTAGLLEAVRFAVGVQSGDVDTLFFLARIGGGKGGFRGERRRCEKVRRSQQSVPTRLDVQLSFSSRRFSISHPDVLSLELIRSRGVREGIGDAGKGQDEERDEELHFVVFRWNGGREGSGRRR